MSATDIRRFINALEAVKSDYTCGVCGELCKNPVTLSKCFHIICAEHFEGLKYCPNCKISLEKCSTYIDDRLGPCIESAKDLSTMFDKYKESHPLTDGNASNGGRKRGKGSNVDKTIETAVNINTSKDLPQKTSSKKKTRKIAPIKDSENVKVKQNEKNESKTQSDTANFSILSSVSTKFTKAIEKRNNKGETMLHIACRLGKVDKVTELLNQGANTNTKDNAGWTPLHEVVQNGRLDLVTLLLQFNTLINVPGQSNETPLHEAVRYNHKEIAAELVKNGADINAKNCKGETPMQLGSKEMKTVLRNAADNIMQTQSLNITRISELHTQLDFDDIRLYCVTQTNVIQNKLKLLAKHHNNLHVEAKMSKKVTHLIVDADNDGICQSSLEVLQGIVCCIWILTPEWINKSTEDKLETFSEYEVKGVGTSSYKGPKNARYNKYKQYPGIFDGCHFYLHNFISKYEITKTLVVTKAILTKLITDAGGVVLRRAPNPEAIPDSEQLIPYHAKKDGKLVNCGHYIIFKDIYEPMYNMQHLKALPIGWLIECIEKYELCEPW